MSIDGPKPFHEWHRGKNTYERTLAFCREAVERGCASLNVRTLLTHDNIHHLEEFHAERASSISRVGNIYVGTVTNVEPAIQAAFIDFGIEHHGFLHVTDMADAVVLLMERYDDESIINVGCGEDVTIKELCEIVMAVTGYSGQLAFDSSKPDGVPRKLLDVNRIGALGWRPRVALRSGIEQVYAWFIAHADSLRASS